MIALGLASCGENSSDKERIAQLEAKLAELESKDSVADESAEASSNAEATSKDASSSYSSSTSSSQTAGNIPGTYEFTDELNNTWILKVNADETATIGLKESDYVAYGSWTDNMEYSGYIGFSFYDQSPKIWFPAGEKTTMSPCIKEGYVYESYGDMRSKNPRLRLAIKKVN